MDTLDHLLALKVTSTAEQDRAQVGEVVAAGQASTAATMERVYVVDQGYTGSRAAEAAKAHGMELTVVKQPEAKRGFVLLPKR